MLSTISGCWRHKGKQCGNVRIRENTTNAEGTQCGNVRIRENTTNAEGTQCGNVRIPENATDSEGRIVSETQQTTIADVIVCGTRHAVYDVVDRDVIVKQDVAAKVLRRC